MKVYLDCNHDDRNCAMVAAKNLKEAAHLFNSTPNTMRRYGWRLVTDAEDIALAMASPGKVFYRPILRLRNEPWSEQRSRG